MGMLWDGYLCIQRSILPSVAITLRGMAFDPDAHRRLMATMRADAVRLKADLDRLCDGRVANHGSTAQVSAWIIEHVLDAPADPTDGYADFCARLQARCGTTWRRTKTGQLAITKGSKARKAEQLAQQYPEVSNYLLTHLQWNKATKLLNAFGAPLRQWLDPDGRIRGQLRVGGTVTLRHTAERPNVQQMPRLPEFRAIFVAPGGRCLVICDFSQIELRAVAILAHDEKLLEVYRQGVDVHGEVAAAIGLPRGGQSKGVSFAMVYGAGVAGVAEASGLTIERATEVVGRFLGTYQGVAVYRELAPIEAAEKGYIAIRPHRRVLYDPAQRLGTAAINYPVQGAAASVQMLALRRVYDALRTRPDLDTYLAGAIHDELILEAPADQRARAAAEILQVEMRAALLEIFPEAVDQGADRLAKATICNSWAEKE
jgi:DNA polymerase I-like protein with 3'-5' exonuclease and polymerase domains